MRCSRCGHISFRGEDFCNRCGAILLRPAEEKQRAGQGQLPLTLYGEALWPSERIEGCWTAKTIEPGAGGYNDQSPVRELLILLSDRRLLLLRKAGFLGSRHAQYKSIPLEGIKGLGRHSGLLSRGLIVSYDSGNGMEEMELFGLYEVDPATLKRHAAIDPPQFQALLAQRMGMRKREMEAEERRRQVTTVEDFSRLRERLSDSATVVTFPCPRCGERVLMPYNGRTTHCDDCGAKINADQVSKMLKSPPRL